VAVYFAVREDIGLTVAGVLALMALFHGATINRKASKVA